MQEYQVGYELKENEYLFKNRGGTGFLSKLNKNGTIPKNFDNWNVGYGTNITKLPIYVFEETYRSGWKLSSWRFGESQNWAEVICPEGFSLEIYLQQFLSIIQNNTIVNGEIIGEFMWKENQLIKKDGTNI